MPKVAKQVICECSAAAIVELTECQHVPGNSSWNACWLAGDLMSMTHSVALMHMSLTCVVCCHVSSMHMAGRDNCSVAMVLGAVQQCEHGTHADKHKCVRELEHACTIKCGILTEAVPCKHHGDNSPCGPNGGECSLQHEELDCDGDFQGDKAGICKAYVDSGGEGRGEGVGHLGARSRMCGCTACGCQQWGGWGCTAVMQGQQAWWKQG